MIVSAMKTSPTYENIQRALDAPSGQLIYLKVGDLFKKGDFYEDEGNVIVIDNRRSDKGNIHAGYLVVKSMIETIKPRRYIA